MSEIRAFIHMARRRLELARFLAILNWTIAGAALIALALVIVDRIPASAFVLWPWVVAGLAALALVVAWAVWRTRRQTDAHVALVVDERLDLREKLSTALHCEGRQDTFARAALDDAVNVARDPKNRELLSRRFRIAAPAGWWISPLVVFIAVMGSFLHQIDLFAQQPTQAPDITKARAETVQAVEAVVKTIEERPALSREMSDLLGQMAKAGEQTAVAKTPEQIKREALKKVTELEKKLDELINGEKGKTAEALEKALNQIKNSGDGPAKELIEAMAAGDMKTAQEALKALMEKVESGSMTAEQKQQAADQLQQVAQQLQQAAQQQQQLEQALQQAGMDKALAQNPQALQQALQQNQNLNEQQKQQLQQMAQAQQQANQMCQGLGQACQNMAQAMGQQQGGQQGGQQGNQGNQQQQQGMGEAGQQMQDQLNAMEQLQQLLNEAKAAQGACKGQCQGLGQGLGMQQAMMQGGGMGNRGQGAGGKAPIAPTPTGTTMVKADIKTQQGDIIAKQLFDGPQIKGESKAKIVQVVAEAKKGFDEAIAEEQLPQVLHDVQQHYFGELEKLTETIEGDGEAADAPAQPAAEGD